MFQAKQSMIFWSKNTFILGIVRNFKVQYWKKILKSLINKMEMVASIDDLIKKIPVLDANVWMKAAITDIKHETVTNCFRKCGIPIT